MARYTIVANQELAGAKASVIDLKSDGVALVDFTGLPQVHSGKVYDSLTGHSVMAVTMEAGPAGTDAPTEQPQIASWHEKAQRRKRSSLS